MKEIKTILHGFLYTDYPAVIILRINKYLIRICLDSNVTPIVYIN